MTFQIFSILIMKKHLVRGTAAVCGFFDTTLRRNEHLKSIKIQVASLHVMILHSVVLAEGSYKQDVILQCYDTERKGSSDIGTNLDTVLAIKTCYRQIHCCPISHPISRIAGDLYVCVARKISSLW